MKIVILLFCFFLFSLGAKAQCDSFADSLKITHPSCPDFSDGAIEVFPYGGTAPYEVTITDSAGVIVMTIPTANILVDGWYYIEIVDSDGCVLLDSAQLVDPDSLDFEMTIVPESTEGSCDGYVEVETVYGEEMSEVILMWSPGGPSGLGESVKTDVCAGEYELMMLNMIGCYIIHDFTVGVLSGIPSSNDLGFEVTVLRFQKMIQIDVKLIDPLIFYMYDMSGNLLNSIPLEQGQNNLSLNPADGVYFYSIADQNNRVLESRKVSF